MRTWYNSWNFTIKMKTCGVLLSGNHTYNKADKRKEGGREEVEKIGINERGEEEKNSQV